METAKIRTIQPDLQQIGRPTADSGRGLPPDVMPLLDYKRTFDKEGNERSAKICQTVRNWEIVLLNDARFKGKIKYDEFSRQTYLMGAVPWDDIHDSRPWASRDDSAAFSIIQSDYGLINRSDFYDALNNVAMMNRFHPVRELLESLEWDGEEHISQLLPDYLGTENSSYNFEVMKLWMLGAISRVYEPGVKFDYTLILEGRQGLGKSTFFEKMALKSEFFNDSLDSLDGKDAQESLIGSWIIELAELKSLSRTAGGIESVKRFLTAKSDKYRAPYARRTDIIPRQCVFCGTTNRSDFLTDETGNRRFLVIYVGVTEPKKDLFSEGADQDFRQAWAQALYLYKTQKPPLVLSKKTAAIAEKLQEENMGDDGKAGIIREYIKDKKRTCALEIWQEALEEKGRPQKWQTSEINSILEKTPGWRRMKSPGRFGVYGSQRGYENVDNDPENVDIRRENVDIGRENVDIQTRDFEPFECEETPFDV